MVLLLISALASMVNVMEFYAVKELAFLGSENQNKYYNWLHFSPFKERRPTFIWLEAAQ